jgi:hypothetical protein
VNLFWRDLGQDQKGEYISARLLKIASAMTMRASLGLARVQCLATIDTGLALGRVAGNDLLPWEVRFLALPARS